MIADSRLFAVIFIIIIIIKVAYIAEGILLIWYTELHMGFLYSLWLHEEYTTSHSYNFRLSILSSPRPSDRPLVCSTLIAIPVTW